MTDPEIARLATSNPVVHDEIAAMAAAYYVLAKLDRDGQLRSLRWLTERLDTDHIHKANVEPYSYPPITSSPFPH